MPKHKNGVGARAGSWTLERGMVCLSFFGLFITHALATARLTHLVACGAPVCTGTERGRGMGGAGGGGGGAGGRRAKKTYDKDQRQDGGCNFEWCWPFQIVNNLVLRAVLFATVILHFNLWCHTDYEFVIIYRKEQHYESS